MKRASNASNTLRKKAKRVHQPSKTSEPRPESSRKVPPPPDIRNNERILFHLEVFFDLVPPKRLKSGLLTVLMLYLMHEHDTLPGNFNDIASDYHLLFQLLDAVDEELTNAREQLN